MNYIRPIHPIFLENIHIPSIGSTIAAYILFILVITIVSLCIGKYATHKWNGKKRSTTLVFILISIAVAIALICFFGLSARTIKGIIFCYILLISSYSDIKSRKCDDYLSVMLLLAGFIEIDISALPGMFVAGLFTAGNFLFVLIISSTGIGGADIKIASASAFLLGFRRGIIGIVAGLLLAIIINTVKQNKKSCFPMIPYFTAAFIPAYFL